MFDLKIVGGTVVDGTGADRFRADVGVKDRRIVEVRRVPPGGDGLAGDAAVTLDATDRIVTPGFVDIHTHSDGQVSWDSLLEPSSCHGVTTVVTGNCGLGFAPVRPGSEEWLINLMESVEDIPGSALTENLSWVGKLSRVSRRHRVAAFRSSTSAVRSRTVRCAPTRWVSAAHNEPATPEDIAAMARLMRESIEAGALRSSTSQTIAHRAMYGEPVPGTFAAEDELFGLGRALAAGGRAACGRAVFELAPQGAAGEDIDAPKRELEWMRRLGESDLPVDTTKQLAGHVRPPRRSQTESRIRGA